MLTSVRDSERLPEMESVAEAHIIPGFWKLLRNHSPLIGDLAEAV